MRRALSRSFAVSARLLHASPLRQSPHHSTLFSSLPASKPTLFKSTPSTSQFRFLSFKTAPVLTDTSEMKKNTTERLAALRELMRHHRLNAYIVPSEDAHQSEYIADCDKRREFISGFSGSYGFAVITLNEAALWTDGRYFAQAEAELDENWVLMKSGLPSTPSREDWLCDVLPTDSVVGIDPSLISILSWRSLSKSLTAKGHSLLAFSPNLIDQVWSGRPARPCQPLQILPCSISGSTPAEKIQSLREKLKEKQYCGMVVSALDEIAWLFDLRGNDISFNPVFFAYALVAMDRVILYTAQERATAELAQHLPADVSIAPYEAIFGDVEQMARAMATPERKLLVSRSCSWALCANLPENLFTDDLSPIASAKAIKNHTEQQGMRDAHIRDAVALVQFFAWVEKELNEGTPLDEIRCAEQLQQFRSQQSRFVGLSFETISASGPNGAIIHYRPAPGSNRPVTKHELYLCDSGGQYLDGTTDVTRTLHFGVPTERERRCYTRVLQGHISLDSLIFPKGSTGYQLDPFARRALWSDGLDYRHGTGHGVGFFLNVHEGPHGIGTRIALNEVALQAGMTVTNEPGYYEDGQFGIRIENVLLVEEAATPNQFGPGYLCFTPITLVPMARSLIDVSLLSPAERQWIDVYHRRCFETLSPLLNAASDAYAWLVRETRPLGMEA